MVSPEKRKIILHTEEKKLNIDLNIVLMFGVLLFIGMFNLKWSSFKDQLQSG